MYLQSVRSPGWRGPMGARYKLSYRSHTDDQNVFSQEQMEESCYLQDSFCVDSDDLEEFGMLYDRLSENKRQKIVCSGVSWITFLTY